jgi:hypothetical protein
MTLLSLVLAIFAHLGHSKARNPEAPRVAEAIAATDATEEEGATLALYAVLESGVSTHPRPQSWDAKMSISCGVWQMPCDVVDRLDLVGQARWWLASVRSRGLASLDSSPKRAARRLSEARALLALARAAPGDGR